MKKIILLENQTTRQQGIQINCEKILGNENCNEKLENFMKNNSIFDEYDVIIIHENIYLESERKKLFNELESYCNEKYLVKFSGNNSQSSINNKILSLSAKTLYENIEEYLKENKSGQANILMLAYGKYWDLNKLLNILQSLNLFIEEFDEENEIDFDEFEDDFDLLELKKILSKEDYKSLFINISDFEDDINLEQINILASNFEQLIQEKSNG